MKLGIFAKTFEGETPGRVLSAARRAGFEAVQYNMACSGLGALPANVPDAAAEAVRAAAASAGVEIAAVSATYNMTHPDAATREAGRRAFEAIAAAAPRMGTRLVTVCSGSRDPDDQWRFHPHNDTPAAWDEMVAEFRRIVLDPANLFEHGRTEEVRGIVGDAIRLLGPAIALAHAKDRHADGSFATAGQGVVDWPHTVAALREAGFDGPLVTHGLAAAEAEGVARFLEGIVG